MSFYEENLSLLKNKIPMLYQTIIHERPIYEVSIEETNNMSNYSVSMENRKCYIHSLFDINEEMKQMFNRVDKNVNTIIIFGLGCGHSLNYINDNFKSIENILIVEPSLDIFKAFMKNIKIHDVLKNYKNVTFVVNKNIQYTTGILFEYIKDKISTPLSVVYNISYRTLFNGYYESISEMVVDFVSKTKINLVTNNYFKKLWTYNPIKNMNHEGILINNLFSKFDGKSAIIVSAGPSLNKNMHLLKYVKDKALIAAVGTASKILESNNIKPHFRFAMDSSENEKLIFENFTEDDSILVYSDRVQHEVVPLFKRRLKMILDLDNLTRYIYTKANIKFETVNSGFSIANTALDVLIKLGFKNIIFLGQDLCYTKDKLYADGSWSKNDKIDVEDKDYNYINAKDIYGNDVYTLETFLGMQAIFEEIVAINPNVNYINATEGGIGIKGTKIKTFQQVLDEDLLAKYDYDAFFHDFFKSYDKNDEHKKILNTIADLEDEIDKMIAINEIRIKSLKKIDVYLEKNLTISKIEKETVHLNKYEEDLRKIDAYNNCVKLFMEDTYKIVINKFKYEGDDRKESIMSSKKILEIISNELKSYLKFFKYSVNESNKNSNII